MAALIEQFQNLAASTTTGAINNSSNPVTFSVQSGDGALFPSTTNGPFRVTVSASDGTNAEVMLCTSRSTDSFTCSRGSSATGEVPTPTLLAQSSGAVVSHSMTAGGFKKILSDMIYGDPMKPPTTSLFGTTNQSANVTSVSFTQDTTSEEQGVLLAAQATANDTNIVARLMTAPSTPYNIRMRYRLVYPRAMQYPLAGFCWCDGTKFAVFGNMSRNDATRIRTTTFNSNNSFSGSYDVEFFSWGGFPGRAGLYDIYVSDDGVNRICKVVGTGIVGDAVLYDSRSNTTFLTPTQIGIFVAPGDNSNGNFTPMLMKVVDWTQS